MDRKLAYICFSQRGNTETITRNADHYCRMVYEAGYIPICPYIHFNHILDAEKPREQKDGLDMALELLNRCSLLVLCGSSITEQMQCEIIHARKRNKITTSLDGLIATAYITRRKDTIGTC